MKEIRGIILCIFMMCIAYFTYDQWTNCSVTEEVIACTVDAKYSNTIISGSSSIEKYCLEVNFIKGLGSFTKVILVDEDTYNSIDLDDTEVDLVNCKVTFRNGEPVGIDWVK